MELQTFINNNNDYLSLFKQLNINFKKYSQLGLLIVSYKYNFNYDFDKYPFIKWCKGAIIRLSDNKVICLPPQKALTKHNINDDNSIPDGDFVLQPLIDGTMINLFYHNNEWFLSSRSYIGAKNKWNDKSSFKNMFDDIIKTKNIDLNVLNKDNSYSFVLQHKKNRIVSEIVDNNIILIQEFSPNDNIFIDIQDIDYKNIVVIKNNDINILKNSFNHSFNYQFKGFTLKNNNERINYLNNEYNKVHDLKQKCNFNNKLLTFLYLRQNNLLKTYLTYFKDDLHLFDKYRNIIYIMKNELHNYYINYFIKKTVEKKNIPYHLKPLLFDLHTLYKKNGIKIKNEIINQYIFELPIKKLCFVLNYYIVN